MRITNMYIYIYIYVCITNMYYEYHYMYYKVCTDCRNSGRQAATITCHLEIWGIYTAPIMSAV